MIQKYAYLKKIILYLLKLCSFTFYKIIYNIVVYIFKQNYICFIFSESSYKYQNMDILFNAIKSKFIAIKISKDINLQNILKLARSKVIILDQSTPLTTNIILIPNTICVQIWHSSGLYKKVGFDAIQKGKPEAKEMRRIQRIHGQIDYFIISDEKLIPYYAQAFRKKYNQILALGLIRTDLLLNRPKKVPEKHTKKKILYAPTFRKIESGRIHSYFLDIEILKKYLGNSYRFLLRRHPTLPFAAIPKGWEDASNIPQDILLADVDILITDYSSILFDFSILKKPILLFVPDQKDYTETDRELYLTPEELCPGCVCTTSVQIAEKIAANSFADNKISERFMSACDGKSTERVVQFISSLL